MSKISYVVITPVKDEEQYLELTIKSMIAQTILPSQWIIVDDGSVDRTVEIIKSYSSQYNWIKCVETGDKGPRQSGNRHLKAFYKGLESVTYEKWDFLVKLDGDLSFDNQYFEKCFDKFEHNQKLGIGGGIIVNVVGDQLIPETHPLFHVRGATKIYKRSCWDAIGGIPLLPSYDTLDEIKANMLGFITLTFTDLDVLHHRYTGSSYGKWGSSVKNGLGDYISGYHPLFMFAKCVKRVPQKPYLIGAIGLLWGFLSGYKNRTPRVTDKELIAYIRNQQLRCLTFQKSLWR